jgi:MYXO-CTERM domain-containing protein
MIARRKAPHPFERGTGDRALVATNRTSRLPTIAAIMSALAIVATSADAHAIVRTMDAGAPVPESSDAASDAESDASDETLPPYLPPDNRDLGGVQVPTRVRGTGCGCGSSGNEESAAALMTTAALGLALSRRRRR